MTLPANFEQHRLLLYYKGDISALTLFAQHANTSVVMPEPLPLLSSILEEHTHPDSKVSLHPALLLNEFNALFKLDSDLLKIETGYYQYIDTPQGIVTVHLARFMVLDPPHKLLQDSGLRLRTLPELRGRPVVEMELLRRAYVKVMEG